MHRKISIQYPVVGAYGLELGWNEGTEKGSLVTENDYDLLISLPIISRDNRQ